MPRQKTNVGDVFWVPLEDGSFSIGQIVEVKPEVLNSITCAFYDLRSNVPNTDPVILNDLVSVQFVTPDLFKSGKWRKQCNMPVNLSPKLLPYRSTESDGWVGAKVIGSGIINMFLSAFYGLRDWREMYDPNFYQSLLQPGVEAYGYA